MLTYFLKLNFIDARQDSIYLGLEKRAAVVRVILKGIVHEDDFLNLYVLHGSFGRQCYEFVFLYIVSD